MTITNKDLTAGEVTGSGLYDELMRTSKAHLEQEYSDSRIVGKEYATVYLGSMQANLQAATQFVLTRESTNQQLLLVAEQIRQAQKQNELLDLQKEQLRIANESAQYTLDYIMPQQLAQAIAQTSLLQKQVEMTDAQITGQIAQTQLVGKQEDLVDEQIAAAKGQHTTPTGGLLLAQYEKAQAEVAVLTQKKKTEQAQTEGDTGSLQGLVGAELQLKENQADSFIRNAEQATAKLYADIYSLMYSVDPENLTNQKWGLGSDESFEVFKKLSAGINISTVPDIDSGTE